VTFVRAGTAEAEEIRRILVKETERPEYKPGQIIKMMKEKGFKNFNYHKHMLLWREHSAKDPKKGYGVMMADGQWYYYDKWLSVVEEDLRKRKQI